MIREGGQTAAKNRDIAGQTADDNDDEQEHGEGGEAMREVKNGFGRRACKSENYLHGMISVPIYIKINISESDSGSGNTRSHKSGAGPEYDQVD